MSPTTVAYGSPQRTQAGRPIARAGGCMNPATTGPGFPTSPGAGRRITTAAGSSMAGTGGGGRGLSLGGNYPHWGPPDALFFGFAGGGGGGGVGVGFVCGFCSECRVPCGPAV